MTMTREEFIKKYALGNSDYYDPNSGWKYGGGGANTGFLADDKGGNAASEVAGMNVGDYYDKYLGAGADPNANWDPNNKYNGAIQSGWDNVNPHPESSRGNGFEEAWRQVGRPIATAASMYYGAGALNGMFGGAPAVATSAPVVGGGGAMGTALPALAETGAGSGLFSGLNAVEGFGGATGALGGLGGAGAGAGTAAGGTGILGSLGSSLNPSTLGGLKNIAGVASGLGGLATSFGGGGGGGGQDPTSVAQQQATAQQRLLQQQTVANRPNQVGPGGSSSWSQDPATGQWTQTTALNAQDQARLDNQRSASGTMASAGAALAPGVAAGLSQPLNYNNATKMTGYDTNAINQATGKMNAGFDAVPEIQAAMMSRLQPQRDAARAAEQQRLHNQGLTDTSEAYNTAMARLDRGDTDAQMQGLLAGASEHNNIFNRQLAQGNQMFGQQGSMANLSGQQRQQNISEANYLRDRPLTELNAMMGSPVSQTPTMPTFTAAGQGQTPDLVGANNQANALAASTKANQTAGMFGLAGSLWGGKNGFFSGGTQ